MIDTLETLEATPETEALDEAAEIEADQMLMNPDLIELIEEDLQAIGIVGEEDLSLTLYIVGTSRLLPKPLSAIVRGNSGTGKSHVVEKVASLFKNDEQRISATDITPKVLLKVSEGLLEHKFIVSGERARDTGETGQERTRIMRQLISEGKASQLVTERADDGVHHAIYKHVNGPIAYVETTTYEQDDIFPEDRSRCLILETDNSPEHKQRILRSKHSARCATGETTSIEQKHHLFQDALVPCEVHVPYWDDIVESLPIDAQDILREAGRLDSTIQTVALLHQKQRSEDQEGRIIATLEDYAVAKRLLEPCLRESLGQRLSPTLKANYKVIADQNPDGEFTTTQAEDWAEEAGQNRNTMRSNLPKLQEADLVRKVSANEGPRPAKWCLTSLTIDEADEILPRPEDLGDAISGSRQYQQA